MVNKAPCLLFGRAAVERLLDLDSVIAAVEAGFGRLAAAPNSGVLGLSLPGGGLHVKTAVFEAGQPARSYLAAKLNVNLPGNPDRHGLPTIQGLVALLDVETGVPLAVIDSMTVTVIRTAAATAVAAKHLALPGATRLTIIGCGAQAFHQVVAIHRVRALSWIRTIDPNRSAAVRLAARLVEALGVDASPAEAFTGVSESDIVVTCTPATVPVLSDGDLRPGTFVAAVGADSERKSEIAPALMARAVVVTDDRRQCAAIGDLHHAIAAGVLTMGAVRADLGEVVSGAKRGREAEDEIVVFDSTGLPFQDVVTAALVWERGLAQGVGTPFDFAS